VAKVGTIKTPTGYGISWSTQLNLNTSVTIGGIVLQMFAPKWSSVYPSYSVTMFDMFATANQKNKYNNLGNGITIFPLFKICNGRFISRKKEVL
jgi:hypothetical protein